MTKPDLRIFTPSYLPSPVQVYLSTYLVDFILLLSQGLHLFFQGLQFGSRALVVLSEGDRLFQLMLQPIRVYNSTGAELINLKQVNC